MLDYKGAQSFGILDHDTNEQPRSARPPSSRARFVGNCVAHDLLPRACLVVRRSVTTELRLQHQVPSANTRHDSVLLIVFGNWQGIGDEVAILLAKSLSDLPYLMKVDLRFNRCTVMLAFHHVCTNALTLCLSRFTLQVDGQRFVSVAGRIGQQCNVTRFELGWE